MRIHAGLIAAAALLVPCRVSATAEDRLWLVRDGQARLAVVHGTEDDFAAERFERWFSDKVGSKIDVHLAAERQLPEAPCVVLVGTPASNPLIGEIVEKLAIRADPTVLTDQGYVAKRLRHDGRDVVLLAGGGRDGAIHAVVDLLNWHVNHAEQDVWLDSLDTRQIPRFRYRWFWTWDNRMQWGGPGKPVTRMGGGKYEKRPEAFRIDYKRCIDYMADHKFNGLIIWGFLRTSHGGVDAAQELCRYARRRGVRILPGVGTSGYAGYFYEGNHAFNAGAWLSQHPELRSLDKRGKPRSAPCPSKTANQQWLDRGAQWLFQNFQVGGVNLEMGDFYVCYCDDCRQARAAIPSDEPDYYKDMAVSHRVTLKTIRALAPQAWLSYATYTGYTAEMMQNPPRFLSMIPGDAICQWTLTGMAGRWPEGVRPMARHNLGYLHWCNTSTHTEDDFYLERVRSICRNAAAAGFEGLDTYGELSNEYPNAEIFYLAWEAFLWDPEMTIAEFVDRRLARLYGGVASARTLIDVAALVRTRKQRENPQNCAKARNLAESARRAASAEGHRRWDRLIRDLKRHERVAREAMAEPPRPEAAAPR